MKDIIVTVSVALALMTLCCDYVNHPGLVSLELVDASNFRTSRDICISICRVVVAHVSPV